MDSFHTEPCSDFKDCLLKVEEQKNKWWIYRGQQIDSWPLKHTFERACQRFGVKGNDRFKVESNMIREFKRRIHHYISNIPLDDSTDEWMALMQHHGAPTRLLDWSASPYVAAYFAVCCDDEADGEIWSFSEPDYATDISVLCGSASTMSCFKLSSEIAP